MKKASLLITPILMVVLALVWVFTESTENQVPYRVEFGYYLMKNDGKIPRALRRPSDWFMYQRAYPNETVPHDQYREAIVAAQRMRTAPMAQDAMAAAWVESGPNNTPGRITDLAVHPTNPNTVIAGGAAGGVFMTTDLGLTWTPIFDSEGTPPIGAVAYDPTDGDVIYVGTGEGNPAGDTYEGTGIYKSINGGASWSNIGLPLSYRINRIIVDPLHPDTVFVAVQGGRWSSSSTELGVYRSEDGGGSWSKVHYVSTAVGCVDLAYNHNTGTLIAAMWQRFSGPGSSIWRSTDYGTSWTQLGSGDGLPSTSINAGRIGVAMEAVNGVAYALYANGSQDFYGLYKSVDDGATWTTTNDGALTGMNASWSGGWYFGQVRVAPGNPNDVYAGGLDFWRSLDGGNSWSDVSSGAVHVDQHALVVLPSDPNIVYLGCDGGVYYSSNKGSSWTHMANQPSTQFYAITIDHQNPQRIYGGTQDNGTYRTLTGNLNDWDHILGGDGFYTLVDWSDPNTIYAESQYGNLAKSTDGGFTFGGATNGIDPGDPTNWNTPIAMDHNDPKILYYGSDEVYRTTDGAESWVSISPDITGGTITTIAVSRTNPDYIIVGCSDTQVYLTFNGGATWNFMSGLPARYVTRVEIDPHDETIAYATFSGYKAYGEFLPHIYRTTNTGGSWSPIHGDLPDAPINDVIVDYHNANTLYVGTDVGVFVTKDLGTTWTPFGTGMPITTIHDLAYHIPTGGLVAGTHGRSTFRTTIPCDDETDTDGDGIGDDCDNCPGTFNPLQTDADYDFIGDDCDECTDTDGDGYGNPGYAANTCDEDNCPTSYNPDQIDTDSDGIGDACDYRVAEWDTVATTCVKLAVGSNGSFGRNIPGATLDYSDFGDCNANADIYMYDGTAIVVYHNGSEVVAGHSGFGDEQWNLVDHINLAVPTITTADYDVYESGTMVTLDNALALEKTWWAPKQVENCHFVVQRMKVFSADGASHSDVYVGDGIDWDIPTGNNRGGVDASYNLVYQYGQGTDCQNNEERFGAIALLGHYMNNDTCDFQTSSAWGGYVKDNPTWIYPYSGYNDDDLYSNMSTPGFSAYGGATDLHSVMTYAGDVTIGASDTLWVYAIIHSAQQGTVDDLRDNVDLAKDWVRDYLGISCGCCGKYTSGYTGNVNQSTDGKSTLSDITMLIDHVYISKNPLPCPEDGNTNGSMDGSITLSDITRLIDNVYISKNPTEPCL